MRRHSVFSHAVRAHSARDSWLNFLIKNQCERACRGFWMVWSICSRFSLSVGCADSSPIEGAKRRKKAAFGAPSVRKGLQWFVFSFFRGLWCHNPMLAIPVDTTANASYYLFIITPLYQVGMDFVIFSYQLSTSFAWFIITWIWLCPKGIAQGTEDKVLLLI